MQNTSLPAVSGLFPHLWKSTLLSGVLAVVLGVLMLAWPGKTLLIAAILFGVYLVISGIYQVFFALTLHISSGGRFLLFISGTAAIVLAVLAFRQFGDAILLLAIWIAVGFVFRGVATLSLAISDPALPARGWEIFFGAVSLVAGIVMLAWPGPTLLSLLTVVGVWLIVIGGFEIGTAFAIRKDTKALTA